MRKIFNKIFRYRLVSIYFILSQLVILTAIFGVLNTINKAYAKENDRLKALACLGAPLSHDFAAFPL